MSDLEIDALALSAIQKSLSAGKESLVKLLMAHENNLKTDLSENARQYFERAKDTIVKALERFNEYELDAIKRYGDLHWQWRLEEAKKAK